GIGSSREHAVWAIKDFGFKAILGVSFADIFYNNCFKNGILVIKLDKEKINYLFTQKAEEDVEIDLSNQTIKVSSEIYEFGIDTTLKTHLLEGIDEISNTLNFEDDIHKYELDHNYIIFN
ncbi:MAG TPA: 3-isopropylmalate dehydratase small subunit, partial [Candidatus Nitrosocosmicus sp.]